MNTVRECSGKNLEFYASLHRPIPEEAEDSDLVENARAILAGAVPSNPSILLYATNVEPQFESNPWFFLFQSFEANFFLIEHGCDPDSISYVEIEAGAIHVKHIWLGRRLA